MSVTISVRALDQNFDPIWGNGQGAFITDIDAVRQILVTTILLLVREWWESLSIGTRMFPPNGVLGSPGTVNSGVSAAILQERILSAPYVDQILSLQVSFDSASRHLSFSCSVATAFGTVSVTGQPSQASLNQ